MNNLKQAIEREVRENGGSFPTLRRIKIGRWLFAIANIPIGTSALYLISVPMMMTLSPTLWAKDKIRWYKAGRVLR